MASCLGSPGSPCSPLNSSGLWGCTCLCAFIVYVISWPLVFQLAAVSCAAFGSKWKIYAASSEVSKTPFLLLLFLYFFSVFLLAPLPRRMRAVMVYLMRFESAFSCSMRLMRKFDLFFPCLDLPSAASLLSFFFFTLYLCLFSWSWPTVCVSVTFAGCGILSEGQLENWRQAGPTESWPA